MRSHEGKKCVAVAQGGDVTGDAAAEYSICQKEIQGSQAEHHSGGIALKGDADVVLDVEAKHQPVARDIARAADGPRRGAVHLIELGSCIAIHDGEDQVRMVVSGDREGYGRNHEKRRRDCDVGPAPSHHGWEVLEQYSSDARQARIALAINDLVRPRRDRSKALDDMEREAARAGERQVLTTQPIEGEELVGIEP